MRWENLTWMTRLKQTLKFLLYMVGIAIFAGAFYYIFFVIDTIEIQLLFCCCLLLLLSVLWFRVDKNKNNQPLQDSTLDIKKLVLITSDSDVCKEWYISGMNSVLIGKQFTDQNGVDVDLSDTIYSEYISDVHAVLNHSGGYWYIEDLGSKNGVGIKRHRDEYALRIRPLTPYVLRVGDLLYIGKIKILIQ